MILRKFSLSNTSLSQEAFSVSHCRNVLTHRVSSCFWLQRCPESSVVQSSVHIMKSKLLHVFKKKRSDNWPLFLIRVIGVLESIPAFTGWETCNLSRMKRGKSNLFPWMDSWELIADFIYEFINFSLAWRTTSVKRCWPKWQKGVNHR